MARSVASLLVRKAASEKFVIDQLKLRGITAKINDCDEQSYNIYCYKSKSNIFNLIIKHYVIGARSVIVGKRAQTNYGKNYFWILVGIPINLRSKVVECFIMSSSLVARKLTESHQRWLKTPGKKGQKHNENSVRIITLPPYTNYGGWQICKYKNRWETIEKLINKN
jgi:hypothetical protein